MLLSSPTTMLGVLFALCVSFIADSSSVCSVTFQYSISEEQPIGTKVGSLLDDLRKQDGDLGLLDSFHIIRPEETLPFTVNAQDGLISTKGQLDNELLCPTLDVCELDFTVQYRKGKTVDCLKVQVAVVDRNDNGPSFLITTLELELLESSAPLTTIQLAKAVDQDKGLNGLHSYSLSPNENFALAVTTSKDGTKQPELVLLKRLDREIEYSYQLTLFAWDGGSPTRSASILVHIKVTDANDNIPVFERDEIIAEVAENVTRDTVIARVRATDPDEGINSEIRYTIGDQTNPLSARLFEIDPRTGDVRAKNFLDYEEQNSHDLIIQAKDMGPGAIPSFYKLHINLIDVNDNAPTIAIYSPTPNYPYISELAEKGSLVTHIRVSDPDEGQNGKVVVWLEEGAGPFKLVKISENEYKLLTKAALNRDERYSMKIWAEDLGASPLRTSYVVSVEVRAHVEG